MNFFSFKIIFFSNFTIGPFLNHLLNQLFLLTSPSLRAKFIYIYQRMTVEDNPQKRQKTHILNTHLLAKSRSISSYHQNLPKHPLGIKPSANIILSKDTDLQKIKHSAGDAFNKLSDDIILTILGLLDRDDLLSCTQVSKFWYAFSTFDELWRNMYTQSTPEERISKKITFDEWKGSWKNSILHHKSDPIDCTGLVYSDALFTPYANSCIDYEDIFHDIIIEQEKLRDIDGYWDANILTNPSKFPYRGRIPRIDEETFTYEMFEKNHWNDHPFILGSKKYNNGELNRWPKWTIQYLLEKFPNVKFRQESVLWELSLYEAYANENHDENPLYLFDCRSNAMKDLLPSGYYPNPPIFAKDDLFKIFNSCRPDHSWLITGPQRSGSTFHKDPNSTDAWNVVLQGSKLWVMLPPGMKPPGVFVSDDESEVMSPNGLAEWVKSGFWNDSIQISNDATLDDNDNQFGSGGFRTCIVGITFENECMYVPSGWWHIVINLQDSVAFTANFVPPCKINKVLKFMNNKRDQVSGFRHDLLQFQLNEFIKNYKGDENENIKILKEYLAREDLKNNDEDVGELKGTGCMPVFETFVEFLKINGYEDLLNRGLKEIEMENAKIKENEREKKSKIWEDLTKQAKEESTGFSFGFGFDDDDE